MPFLRMLWSLSLGLTNALQFTGPNQINADDELTRKNWQNISLGVKMGYGKIFFFLKMLLQF